MKFFLLTFFLISGAWANFSSEEMIAVNLTRGNTQVKTYTLKSSSLYQWSRHTVKLAGQYDYSESAGVRSGENWSLGPRYDLALHPKFSLYLGEVVEANRFAGIKRRYNSDVGGKYFFTNREEEHFFVELGYRYTVEKSTESSALDNNDSKGRLYGEYSVVVKKDLSAKFWAEYLPNFSRSADYLINLEPSVHIALGSIFALKSAYLWKYDNAPFAGKGKHDASYTLSLLAKF